MEASRTTALAALSTRPIPGTADSVAPASHLFLRYGALHPRFEAPLELPVRRDLVARFPQVEGQADDGTARVRVPVRRAETDESGHQIDAAVIENRICQGFDFRG